MHVHAKLSKQLVLQTIEIIETGCACSCAAVRARAAVCAHVWLRMRARTRPLPRPGLPPPPCARTRSPPHPHTSHHRPPRRPPRRSERLLKLRPSEQQIRRFRGDPVRHCFLSKWGVPPPRAFFYLNMLFNDALVNISNFCYPYYISYIKKKPVKRVEGPYFCLLLACL